MRFSTENPYRRSSQIGRTKMYMNDTSQMVAHPYTGDIYSDWMGTLAPYYARQGQQSSIYSNGSPTLICPAAPCNFPLPAPGDVAGTVVSAWDWSKAGGGNHPQNDIVGSYGFNQWLYSDSGTGGLVDGGLYQTNVFMNQGNIHHPSMTPVLMDCNWINLLPLESDLPPNNLYAPGYSQNGMSRCCIPRNGSVNPGSAPKNFVFHPGVVLPGSINMGLMDGHVELAKLQNLWTYYWHATWVPSSVPP